MKEVEQAITREGGAEEALRECIAILEFTLDAAQVGDWNLDLIHDTAQRSLRHDQVFGYKEPVPEWGFRKFIEHVHPDDRAEIERTFREAVEQQKPWRFECRVIWPDGSTHWIAAHGRIYRTADGKPTRMLGIVLNITGRKQAEESIRESDERIRLATEATGVGIWEWNVITDKIRWDAQMFRIYGLAPTKDGFVSYAVWRDAVVPEDLRQQEEILRDTIRRCGHGTRQFHIRRYDDKQIRHIQSVETVRTNAQGQAEWVVGTNLDTTERKRAEDALRESEGRLRLFIEHAPAAIAMFDRDMRYLAASRRWKEDYRVEGDILGRSHYDVFPDVPERWKEIHRRGLAGEILSADQDLFERNDGKIHWIKWEVRPWYMGNREVGGILIAAEEVTARVQAQQALRESEERLSALAENIPQLAWMADENGWLFWYNKRWYDYTGMTFEEMQGWGWEKVHHPDHLQRVIASWKPALAEGKPWEDTFPLRGKDGKYRWFLSRAFPIRDTNGKISRWFGTNTDITELRETQEELKEAQKNLQLHASRLEATVAERTAKLQEIIGELEAFSYSLSHDMRAPLRAIQGFTQIALEECGEKAKPFLSKVVSSARRLDRMIQAVLSYTRTSRQEIRIEPVDVDRLLHEIILERPELQPPNAEVRVERSLLPMQGHEGSLTQCLTNLLGNAVKFVPRGVTPRVRIFSEVTGNAVRLWIEDNGIGIEPEAQRRLFEMFYRVNSENEYEGTGIGLAIVRKAIERMGGQVGVESQPGRGSRFWVQLPKVE